MAVTIADINKLRQQTGAGMMDCKKALEETNGNFEAAIDYLRKKGAKVAANRQDRDAKEGLVLAKINSGKTKGVLLVVNCETDFVAKNKEFSDFVYKICDIALEHTPTDVESLKKLSYDNNITVHDKLMEMVGKIGEKIDIGYYQTVQTPYVYSYIHPGNRLAVLVGFNKPVPNEEIAMNIAMQAAAMAPIAIDKDDVDPKTLERELEIAREQVKAEGKPENMIEKIAQGKLNKFFKESTLLNQEFFIEPKLSVREYLSKADKELTVSALKRFSLPS